MAREAGRARGPHLRAGVAVDLVGDGRGMEAVVDRIVDLFRERVPVEAMVSAGDPSAAG